MRAVVFKNKALLLLPRMGKVPAKIAAGQGSSIRYSHSYV